MGQGVSATRRASSGGGVDGQATRMRARLRTFCCARMMLGWCQAPENSLTSWAGSAMKVVANKGVLFVPSR